MTPEQERLVSENIDLAKRIANMMSSKYIKGNECLKEDAEAVALEQLCLTATRFDVTKGIDFPIYAASSMKWAILKFFRREFSKGMSYSNNVKLDELMKFKYQTYSKDEIPQNDDEILLIEEMTDLYSLLESNEAEILSLFLEGYNPNEMSEILGVTSQTVRVRARHLKDKMKTVFGLNKAV